MTIIEANNNTQPGKCPVGPSSRKKKAQCFHGNQYELFVRSRQVMTYTERLMTDKVVSVIGYAQGTKVLLQPLSWIRISDLYCPVEWFSNLFVHGTLLSSAGGKKMKTRSPNTLGEVCFFEMVKTGRCIF
jgi:hypothetical protein